MKKNKIFITIPGLNLGGVDKSLLSFCNKYHNRFDITLLIFGAAKTQLHELPSNIKLVNSSKRLHVLTTNRRYIIKHFGIHWYFIKAFFHLFSKIFTNTLAQKFFVSTLNLPVESYDYAIAWSNDGNEKTLCFGSEYIVLYKIIAKKKILYMHNDYHRNHIYGKHNNFMLNKFDYIWCISKSVKAALMPVVINQDKLRLCHCFVDSDLIQQKAKEPVDFEKENGEITFVSSCRLSYEKGIDRGIKIFSKIKEKVATKFRWVIIGGGSIDYKNLSKKMRCDDVITFLGQKENPYPYIKKCDVYLSFSRYEGAPISFLEAKVLNKKIITTNYISADEQLSKQDIVIPNNDIDIEKQILMFLCTPNFDNNGIDDVALWNKEAENEIESYLV